MLDVVKARDLISQGAKAWNQWRAANKGVYPSLDGIELHHLDLSGIDLSGVSLCQAIINNCNLRSASLVSAQLKEANLRNNDFSSARMIAADLTDADLSGSIIQNANILTTIVRGARFEGVDFTGQDMQALDLRDVSLKGANLSDQYLARSDFSGANLDQCQFFNSDLSDANLQKASLANVDFSSSKIQGANFFQANLSKAIFLANTIAHNNFEQAMLTDCDFRQSTIQHSNFHKADLTGCLLWEVHTTDWILSDVICHYAYWDKEGKRKTHYGKHGFERIYSDSITIELAYPFRLSNTEISTLPILIEHLQASHWGTSIRLKSIKDDAGGSLVILSIDELSAYNPSELREMLQREANSIMMAQTAMRKDTVLQQALKEEVANVKENFWPRLLELASENEREIVHNLTVLFMDLTGFSRWKEEELAHKLELFRGLLKPVLQRWGANHPNMEGDSLRISFKNATVGLACACMIRNVLVGAGFDLRIGLELGEVSIVHNVVTNQLDLEGSAVSLAARLEAAAEPGEILVTDKVKYYADQNNYFEFTSRQVPLKKAIGNQRAGDLLECYAVKLIKPVEDF